MAQKLRFSERRRSSFISALDKLLIAVESCYRTLTDCDAGIHQLTEYLLHLRPWGLYYLPHCNSCHCHPFFCHHHHLTFLSFIYYHCFGIGSGSSQFVIAELLDVSAKDSGVPVATWEHRENPNPQAKGATHSSTSAVACVKHISVFDT